MLFSPSQGLWHTKRRLPYIPKGAVISQAPYAVSGQISASLGSTHPTSKQKECNYKKLGFKTEKQKNKRGTLGGIMRRLFKISTGAAQ